MTDILNTPRTATLSGLVAALLRARARTVADTETWEDPRDRTHRLEAAIRRREALRDAVHDLLR